MDGDTLKIGEYVRNNIDVIFEYCEYDPTELERLKDAEYSRRNFRLAWPFCQDADAMAEEDHKRYWTDRYDIGDKRLRVCSQWIERQRAAFDNYLTEKGIAHAFPPKSNPGPPSVPYRRGSRYRRTEIGDAQNAFIRFILSRLGEDSFDKRDWQETKAYFDNRCAYCDDAAADQMDHGVPINRSKLGEHRLGNIIPACKSCNTGKHQRDYREYLHAYPERIDRIETYMASRGYVPLGENDQVKRIIEQAHKEVATLADRYVEILNMVLVHPPKSVG